MQPAGLPRRDDQSWPGTACLLSGELRSKADMDVGAAVGSFQPILLKNRLAALTLA